MIGKKWGELTWDEQYKLLDDAYIDGDTVRFDWYPFYVPGKVIDGELYIDDDAIICSSEC